MAQNEELGLMRMKDRNEALGLAVRLLAGEAPFRDMPLGFSIGAIVSAIDTEHYVFASRNDRALGIAYWTFVEPEHAEAWLSEGRQLQADEFLDDGPCVIIMGVQATEPRVVRYLMNNLRDKVLAQCNVCYFLREYGNQARGHRGVRLVRPKIRQQGVRQTS